MDSSAANTRAVKVQQGRGSAVSGAPPLPSSWLRAIIRVVGQNTLTLDQIRRGVGKQIITPETGAIDEYVHALVEEKILRETHDPQKFELTNGGQTLLKGVLATPSAE